MQYTNTQSRRRRLRRRMPVRLGLVLALVIGVATTVDTSGLHSPASVRSAPEVTTHRARHSVDDIKRRALRGTARPIAPRSAFNQPGPLPPRVEQARWVTHAGRTVLAEPDQLIVRFRHEVDTATRDAFVAELGGRIVYASRYTGATLIRLTDPDDLEVALHALDRSGLAHDATPNAVTMGAAWSWGWPSSTSKSTSSTSTWSKSSSSTSSSSASSGGSSWSFSFGSSWSSGSSWGSSSDWSAWWGSPGDWSGWWSGFNWSNWNAWKDWSTGVDWASGTWGQVPDSVVPDAQVSLLDGGATTAGAGTVSEKWDASGLTMAVYVGTTGPTSKPYYPYEWHLHRQFAASGWERAPDMGKDVRIAILDSGISNTPSLGQARILPGANFIDPTKGTADDNGHGSHMANAACGSGRIVGVAPKSLMIPVKVLDADLSGTELALAEGIYFAVDDAGAQVISMSLTFPAGYVPSALLAEAITYAAEAGVVLVGAAGNEGSDTVAYPARFPEVIAVGAATLERDADGMTAATAKYSNRGGALDLVAFGGRMDQDVDGDGVADGILGDRPATKWGAAGPYLTEGTSPAAAQVSGAAAILIARGADAARVRRILVETASRGGVATELFNVDRGAGVLNVGYAVESLVTNAAPFANFAPTFANALLVFEQAAGDLVRPSVIVEVTDDAGVRLANYHVFGQFGGIADEVVHARTDGMGIAVIRGKEAVDPDLGAVTFTVDAVASVPNRHFSRPTGQIDVESLSYALLSNFGAGLASSAIVLDFSPDALARVPYLDISRLAPSYAIRSVGAGLASSALVMAVSPTYYQVSDLARTTLLFRSQGVGLASSAIVLDPVFFSVAYRPQLGLQTVTVRNYVTGSGLASSALIASTGRLPYDAYFTGRNPTVWLMTTGAGLASSAIIFDEAGMLNRDLTVTSSLATWDAGLPAGHGDATSTRLAPYTATTVSTVGQNWSQVSARYPQGSGLASSALISIYNPYIYLRTSSPELLTTRTVIVGQGRTAVPFAAP